MAELNKGFEPFNYYNVGNDYNPLGYGTAKVMRNVSDTISALSGVPNGSIDHTHKCGGKYEYAKFDVIRNVVDTSVNHDEFINGIWHATSDQGEKEYQKPEIMEFITNIPEFITIEKQDPFTEIAISSKINPGSAETIKSVVKLVVQGKEIVLYTTDKPEFDILINDQEVLSIINDLIAASIDFDIIVDVSDEISTVEDKKTIKSVNQCYYGWMNKYDITPDIIKDINPYEGRCAKSIDYDLKRAFFGTFYPEDTNLYIATPFKLGLAKIISNGAAMYTIGTKNTDFIWSAVKINNIDYYLYILQYNNHGSYNLCTIFNKGN